jgi:hypothetical protein
MKRDRGRFLPMMLMLFALLMCGCGLSTSQREALDHYAAEVSRAEVTAIEVAERVEEYAPKVAAVVKAVEEKRMPWEEGQRLLAEYQANEAADRQRLDDAKARIADVKNAVAELKAQEVPWYHYVWPVALAALSAFGGYIPGGRKAALVTRERDAIISGIETLTDTEATAAKKAVRLMSITAGVAARVDAAVKANGG